MSKEEGGIPVPDKTSAPEGRLDKLRIFFVSQHTLTRDGWCRLLERAHEVRNEVAEEVSFRQRSKQETEPETERSWREQKKVNMMMKG